MLLERIKKRAKSFDMSLQDVAEATGISPNTIYSWRKKTPRTDKLQQVAEVLHTTTDYLSGATDDPAKPKSAKNHKLTWKDLGQNYGGDDPVPDEFQTMIDSLAEGYFKAHPELKHKNEQWWSW